MQFSLEQLEAFVAAADEGSFSAAGRHLGKAQSAVSTAVANLEIDLGVSLFDRGGKLPLLTLEGETLLREARSILLRCAELRDRAWACADGEGGVVRLAVDEVVPHELMLEVLVEFGRRYPGVELEILYGVLGDVLGMVQSGRADLGMLVPVGPPPREVPHRLAGALGFSPVVGSSHPLATLTEVSAADLAAHRQLVITSRGGDKAPEEMVFGSRIWKVEGSYMIRDLLLQGVGWGMVADHLIEDDLRAGRLVVLPVVGVFSGHADPVYVLRASGSALGAAGRWLAEALERAVAAKE
ncbi:LysR family transcriptional regulator [Desulfovibrio ferrophilus]|uniref:Transcriptional regulator, LysR family n=1 Tax=Desulfovibrio ferrophilus TaxID=241368 RepID=A0A2Z6B020_9BACT|nr:LysR family transcriptional regulator [Desulfovibrio ferrophilus]BBD08844.1 transcriptional regulator, LysR family [Desulfovibrio ferrophilus]